MFDFICYDPDRNDNFDKAASLWIPVYMKVSLFPLAERCWLVGKKKYHVRYPHISCRIDMPALIA
jgi:hypothetical protein